MKLLLENWRKYLKEDDLLEESIVSWAAEKWEQLKDIHQKALKVGAKEWVETKEAAITVSKLMKGEETTEEEREEVKEQAIDILKTAGWTALILPPFTDGLVALLIIALEKMGYKPLPSAWYEEEALFENWRGFLKERDQESADEMDQLSQRMSFSNEEAVVQHVMAGDWNRAWQHFLGWYKVGKIDVELLVETLDDLLRDEYNRIRKKAQYSSEALGSWAETWTSAIKFITGGKAPTRDRPYHHGDLHLRIYHPRGFGYWTTNTKDMLYNELMTTLNTKKISNETPT